MFAMVAMIKWLMQRLSFGGEVETPAAASSPFSGVSITSFTQLGENRGCDAFSNIMSLQCGLFIY